MVDVCDILDIDRSSGGEVTKESIVGLDKKNKKFGAPKHSKKPEGMARELFALLYHDKNDPPPLFPSDTGQGYKNMKAKLGMKSVRPWKWMPFTNPGRTDNAIFHHWRRLCDEGKEYPFARFNKKVEIPSYTEVEYSSYLEKDDWTQAETDHLFDLAGRFDLRFSVMADRLDTARFRKRSIEDLKERYYGVVTALAKVKTGRGLPSEAKEYFFDADHERRRKEQLERLFSRSPKQVEEEQMLQTELRKIEARKKERDRKTQDLQKLITAADNQEEPKKTERKFPRKKFPFSKPRMDNLFGELSGIKFPDIKGSGVTLRSQRMKFPTTIGQKKMKAIEQQLTELNIDLNPLPTEEICQQFNDLRSDVYLLCELKAAISTCEFEIQSLRHQYEAVNPSKILPKLEEIFLNETKSGEVMLKTEPVTNEPSTSQMVLNMTI
ncbi:DNA methyltransferase 1-associated protein 1 [Halyomorpha halys]|uniref:DNA methyltransferase 1-associated protein 1 n=1 Tax=Halyomorpha halys TaxID=286706 RepID=UPI0006D4EB5D|nr:DNA methyltransferase 1-associated protein 1 [Halyomorpha halys]